MRTQEDGLPEQVRRYNATRRDVLAGTVLGLGGLSVRGLLAGGVGSALVAIVAAPAPAERPLDVQILQTAAALENLAVATYGAALGLDFVRAGNPLVRTFLEAATGHHREHAAAFNGHARQLGGRPQTLPHAGYQAAVEETSAKLAGPADLVTLAATLEQVATQTYLKNLTLLTDRQAKALVASVMGVEAQHLATLRAVGTLVAAGRADLVAVPTVVADLPRAVGSAPFPQAFEGVDHAAPPESGAVG